MKAELAPVVAAAPMHQFTLLQVAPLANDIMLEAAVVMAAGVVKL
jgi:hypothetical protein